MPKPVVIDIAHELGAVEARRRLETGFSRIRDQFGFGASTFEERWEDNRLHFKVGALGQTASGRVDVMDKKVRIELDLPWALAILAEKLQGRIKGAGRLLLEKK
jgi:hypothetical protein